MSRKKFSHFFILNSIVGGKKNKTKLKTLSLFFFSSSSVIYIIHGWQLQPNLSLVCYQKPNWQTALLTFLLYEWSISFVRRGKPTWLCKIIHIQVKLCTSCFVVNLANLPLFTSYFVFRALSALLTSTEQMLLQILRSGVCIRLHSLI